MRAVAVAVTATCRRRRRATEGHTMDLLDMFGGMMGGQQADAPPDLQAQMIAQLGGDPNAMRRQNAMQSLGAMGAAMLAQSGPSTQRHSLASALGAGLQAGQGAYADNAAQTLNHLYTL